MLSREPQTPPGSITEAEAESRLTADRFDILALIAKADHRREDGDRRAANAYYNAAVRTAEARPPSDPFVIAQVERASRAVLWLADIFRNHLLDSLNAKGFGRDRQHPRFARSLDMMFGDVQRPPEYRQFPQKPMAHYYPGMAHLEFADTSQFDWVRKLEAQFPVMQREALEILQRHDGFQPYMKSDAARPQQDHHGLLENADWSTLHLWQNGTPVEEHIRRCPATYRAVMDNVPLCFIGPRAPSVMLSLLRPGAKIPPHTGMLNSRLICHLPLIVPPDCGFRVGGSTIEWEEGKVIAFDDSVEHEAWNNSAFDRLVLIFDIWRPELTTGECEQITAMFEVVDGYR
jgi:aspartyl/asparaginyl beta-hydroxylase (cupin superfamily)